MRTFIRLLTTDSEQKLFDIQSYNALSFTDKITHIVRQSVGIKYLKFLYGKDLWFLFEKYKREIEIEYTALADKAKFQEITRNQELALKLSQAITICNNAFNEPINSFPMVNIDKDLDKFYLPNVQVPNFGSLDFAKTFFTHLKNINSNGKPITFDGKGALIIPYNAINKYSYWNEIQGQSYEFDKKQISAHADKMGIDPTDISGFLTLLVSVKNAIGLQSINSTLALLASMMIDCKYLNDYNGYVTSYNNRPNKLRITDKVSTGYSPETTDINSIIYKGCYRILFDEIENSVFNYINNQCKCILHVNQRSGLAKPLVDNRTAKSLFWLLSYIHSSSPDYLNDNKIITKLITYFEPKTNPYEVSGLLEILHKVPHITLDEHSFLMASGISSMFNTLVSPFSTEAEEAKDPEEDKPKDETGEVEKKDDTKVDDANPDDTEAEDGEEENPETATPEDEEAIETGGEPSPDDNAIDAGESVPQYLLKLGSPPDLNNALYRMELDRNITLILKNPPKSMSNETIQLLTTLQAHWLHLIALPILKLLTNKINNIGA